MLQRKAIRIRLLPTEQQREMLERFAGTCRSVYNVALDQRRWFARPGRSIGYKDQSDELRALKEAFPWVAEAPHHCLQQALIDLQKAYTNFWSGRAGAPKPRKRGLHDSFRFPDPTHIRLQANLKVPDKERTRSLTHATLHLPKLGDVHCLLHRAIPSGTRLLSVTVSRDGTNWMASLAIERTIEIPADRSGEAVVGIDVGVAQPAVLSTGLVVSLPRASAGDSEHLARLQRRISGKKKGSNNRRKAVRRLAAFKARQARIRRDAIEKATTAIAKNHGVIAMEDLRVRQMTNSARGTVEEPGKNVSAKAGLNRSILDVSPGLFRMRLGQKLAASGGMLLLVSAAYTSQRCNRCGHVDAASRDRRHFVCTACGHADDADQNAAKNIRDRARGVWGDGSKVELAASTQLLLAQQARPKQSFNNQQRNKTTGGTPAQACRALQHGRKRAAATRPSGPSRAARSSVL